MNGYQIDLGSSNFEHFIKDGLLYVDKTLLIEHFLENRNTVLLIARPRRMGIGCFKKECLVITEKVW